MTKSCTKCGTKNLSIAQFCSECGHKLGKGSVYSPTIQDQEVGDENKKDELHRLYSTKSDEELIRIAEEDAAEYTKVAIDVATEELLKRGYGINQTSSSTETKYHSQLDSTESQTSKGDWSALFIVMGILVGLTIIVLGYNLKSCSDARHGSGPISRPTETKGPQTNVATATGSEIDTLVLEMTTTDDIWFSIIIDGKERQEFLFPPLRQRVFTAQKEFSITMSNAGGATFKLNGRDIGMLGKRGAVIRNVLINKSNFEPALTSREQISIHPDLASLLIKTDSGFVTTLQNYIKKKIESKEWWRFEITYQQDLDKDGLSELVVEAHSGGNACCRIFMIFRYNDLTEQYEDPITYEAAYAQNEEEVWSDILKALRKSFHE